MPWDLLTAAGQLCPMPSWKDKIWQREIHTRQQRKGRTCFCCHAEPRRGGARLQSQWQNLYHWGVWRSREKSFGCGDLRKNVMQSCESDRVRGITTRSRRVYQQGCLGLQKTPSERERMDKKNSARTTHVLRGTGHTTVTSIVLHAWWAGVLNKGP